MAYPPRFYLPDEIYFVTSRTVDGRLFLRPSEEVNNAIGAVLARAQSLYAVELFDYVFLSNHMHLAVRSRDGHISAFVQYLKANVARAVNRVLRRTGPVWERRFSAAPILDEGAQVDRAVYIYSHGVKEGLVDSPREWPGLSSVSHRLSGEVASYRRLDRTALTKAAHNRRSQARPDPREFTRSVEVTLCPWPFMCDLSPAAARERVAELAKSATLQARQARGDAATLGAMAVLAQDPWSRPRQALRRSPNPPCHASTRPGRKRYLNAYSAFLDSFTEASQRFRAGDPSVQFPAHAFRPPPPRLWPELVPAPRDGTG